MNNTRPKISVLMPVYNCEKFLKKAIDSILNQTFDNFEYIIINDGSTDNTSNIINSYNDKRIKLILYVLCKELLTAILFDHRKTSLNLYLDKIERS